MTLKFHDLERNGIENENFECILNQSPYNSSHSHQRTIQKITHHTFLCKKFVRGFFTNKFIFIIIKNNILLIIYI